MKLEITNVEFLCDNDQFERVEILKIETDDLILEFDDGVPEENLLKKGFGDVYLIEELIKKAYEAGKNGEDLELAKINVFSEEQAKVLGIIY